MVSIKEYSQKGLWWKQQQDSVGDFNHMSIGSVENLAYLILR